MHFFPFFLKKSIILFIFFVKDWDYISLHFDVMMTYHIKNPYKKDAEEERKIMPLPKFLQKKPTQKLETENGESSLNPQLENYLKSINYVNPTTAKTKYERKFVPAMSEHSKELENQSPKKISSMHWRGNYKNHIGSDPDAPEHNAEQSQKEENDDLEDVLHIRTVGLFFSCFFFK